MVQSICAVGDASFVRFGSRHRIELPRSRRALTALERCLDERTTRPAPLCGNQDAAASDSPQSIGGDEVALACD